ncbi:MAG: hypothetical protein NTY68_05070 [Candidatus Micrarchaeota archaeon]|nr:hypothetical protein [Candidatus Micrarchaeota archaeon]
MGRRKTIVIDRVISDEWVDKYNNLDSEKMYNEKATKLSSIISSVSRIAKGGRVERGAIPSYKFGKKRYIPMQFLDELVATKGNFYNIREAFNEYKRHEPTIEFRAFVGRIEKKVIPSIKVGFRRFIPKDAIDGLIHVSNNYYSVAEAIKGMHDSGIKIRKNTFERRLDRGRIPFIKIGGKRFIHNEILNDVIEKEKKL